MLIFYLKNCSFIRSINHTVIIDKYIDYKYTSLIIFLNISMSISNCLLIHNTCSIKTLNIVFLCTLLIILYLNLYFIRSHTAELHLKPEPKAICNTRSPGWI